MMKKIVFFTTFTIIFLVSLNLPSKAFADINCPNGISGQILDVNTGKGVAANLGISVTYYDKDHKKEMVDPTQTYTVNTDKDGKFNYARSLNGLNIILTVGYAEGYLFKETKLTQCFGNQIEIEPKTSSNKDMCNKPCNGPNDSSCENATDGCTYCGVFEENMYKTFYRCMSPPIMETGKEIPPNTTICGDNTACEDCVKNGNSWTALGCLHTKNPSSFVNQLLSFALGIGGGIAFLLIIFGGLQIILSSGNPERVKAGKEILTSALAGLLLIIFSVFILGLIGYNILKIPGFSWFQFGGGQPSGNGASGKW